MNTQNYASREASQRLVDAGIVLETEACWFYGTDKEWHLAYKFIVPIDSIPAPSMAEVWRELPSSTTIGSIICDLRIIKGEQFSFAQYEWLGEEQKSISNANPTDALIDLLIWVRKETP